MDRLLKRFLMSLVVLGAVVTMTSSAHGQNLDVLNGDNPNEVGPQTVSGDTVTPPPEPPENDIELGQTPDSQPSTRREPQVPSEALIKVAPLSDENIKEVVASTKEPVLTADESSRYTLGSTDIIEVAVMRHPEVSGRYEINMEGKIQYEFIGDIVVQDLTKDQAGKYIGERLSEYIVNPDVTVKIVGYNSKVVYVVGEVGRPGKIFMRGNTITVREALLEAGLPLLTGVTKKTRLITPAENGKIAKENVNVYALLYEGDLRQNLTMNPGDILYIPPTFLTKTMRAISPITQPISNAAGTAGTVGAPGL